MELANRRRFACCRSALVTSRIRTTTAAAAAKGSVLPAAAHELVLAKKNATRIGSRLEAALLRCRAIAGGLGITEDVHDVDAGALRQTLQTQIDSYAGQLRNAFAAPRVGVISTRLRATLVEAEREGLGSEIIDVGDATRSGLTITELRRRLEHSAAVIAEIKPPDHAESLRQELVDLERRGRKAEDFQTAQSELLAETKRSRLAEERIAQATAAVMASSGTSVADITAEREGLTAQLRSLSVRRSEAVRKRQELGGGLPEALLAEHLATSLTTLGLNVRALPAEAATMAVRLQEETRNLASAEIGEAAAKAHQRAEVDGASAAWTNLREDGRFAWLRETVGGYLDPEPRNFAVAPQSATNLQALVNRARERADAVRRVTRDLPGVLTALENELAGRAQDKRPPSTLLDAVRAWFGAEVSEWFRQRQVQSTLFGEASTDLRVDLAEMTVKWRIDGEPFSRPITAFSSGEQAFAYTRAQLALLDSATSAPNQLIALDEFGAFMSRDWLGRLETYLRSRLSDYPAESTLLVLPLTRTSQDLERDPALSNELRAGYYLREVSNSDNL